MSDTDEQRALNNAAGPRDKRGMVRVRSQAQICPRAAFALRDARTACSKSACDASKPHQLVHPLAAARGDATRPSTVEYMHITCCRDQCSAARDCVGKLACKPVNLVCESGVASENQGTVSTCSCHLCAGLGFFLRALDLLAPLSYA